MYEVKYNPYVLKRIKQQYETHFRETAERGAVVDDMITEVICSGPVTIIMWVDGEKTMVRQAKGDPPDRVKAFLWAYFERTSGMTKTQTKKWLKRNVK